MKYKTLIMWILIVSSASCQNTKKAGSNLGSTDWSFIGLRQSDGILEKVSSALTGMNISFEKERFHAKSSCNQVYGYFAATADNSLKIDSISMTKMFCVDSLEMVWEDKYVDALKGARSFLIKNDTLLIRTAGNSEMVFRSATGK